MLISPVSPLFWSVDELVSFGDDAIYDLARDAAGTKTSNNLLLGRCLLAVEKTRLYERFGRSGAIHFAISVLGMNGKEANTVRRVARELQTLPLLTQAAERGTVDWSKLREVVSVAVLETEELWLELCRKMTWVQIQQLVKLTPKGGIPGELPEASRTHGNEYRCRFPSEVVGLIERVLRQRSRVQGRPLTFADAVEQLFSEALVDKPFDEAEEKLREEARQEMVAEQLAKEPVVRQARELAEDLGLLETDEPEESLESGPPHSTRPSRAGQGTDEMIGPEPTKTEVPQTTAHPRPSRAERPDEETQTSTDAQQGDEQSASQGLSIQNPPESSPEAPSRVDESATSVEPGLRKAVPLNPRAASTSTGNTSTNTTGRGTDKSGSKTECSESSKGQADQEQQLYEQLLSHLRFNPEQRHLTAAQRRALLRRDRYCCQSPGCPHRLWLHIHHVKWFCLDGKTLPENLVTLCTRCHRNVHEGRLLISRSADGQLLFTDSVGRRLDHTHQIERAAWLDYNVGWRGEERDSYLSRVRTDLDLPIELANAS